MKETFRSGGAMNMEFIKKNKKKIKKKTVAGAAGILAGLSVIVSGLVNMDDDFLRGGEYDENVQNPGNVTKIDRVPSDINQIPIAEKYGTVDRVKLWFWKLPVVVKVLVIGPLWIIGRIISSLGTAALHAVSPFWGVIAGVLIHAALLFALFAGIQKILFPNSKISSLLKKGNWIYFLAGSIVLSGADLLLSQMSEQYRALRFFIGLALVFVVVLLLYLKFFRKNKRPEVHEKWIEIPEHV